MYHGTNIKCGTIFSHREISYSTILFMALKGILRILYLLIFYHFAFFHYEVNIFDRIDIF